MLVRLSIYSGRKGAKTGGLSGAKRGPIEWNQGLGVNHSDPPPPSRKALMLDIAESLEYSNESSQR